MAIARLVKTRETSSTSDGGTGHKIYTINFDAFTQPGDEAWGEENVLADPLCPRENLTSHPVVAGAICSSVAVKPHGNRLCWRITVQYKTKRDDGPLDDPDPRNRSARVGLRTETVEELEHFDEDGWPYLNGAGDPTPRYVTRTRIIYPVTANYAGFPSWLATLNNTTNFDTFTIRGMVWPAFTLLLQNVDIADTPEVEEVSGVPVEYYQARYEIAADPDGWSRIEPDLSFYEFKYLNADNDELTDPSTFDPDLGHKKELVRIVDDNGDEVVTRQWVDRFGRKIKKETPFWVKNPIGQGLMVLGDNELEIVSGAFPSEVAVGSVIAVSGAGVGGRPLVGVVTSIISSVRVALDKVARTGVSSSDIYASGMTGITQQQAKHIAAFTGALDDVS